MTVFPGACSVTSCPFNLGQRGLACDWLRGGRGVCHHPQFKEAWVLGHELEQARVGEAAPILAEMETAQTVVAGCEKMQEPPARPSSLTGRAVAASKPMDAARARQLILELEGA